MTDASRHRDTKAHRSFKALTETTLDDGHYVLDLSGQGQGTKEATVFDIVRQSLPYSQEEFEKRFPHPFLIRITKSDPYQVYQGLNQTHEGLGKETGIESEFMQCPIFELKSREGEPAPDTVRVGRSKNNDVTLNYSCISKRHVSFQKDQNGDWHITDTESLNGTFLDSFRLVPNRPYALDSGREIDLSKHFSFFFVDSKEMFAYIQNVRPSSRTPEDLNDKEP